MFLLPSISAISSPSVPVCRLYIGGEKSPAQYIRDLQPITDRTNPLNIKVGNPSLKPSYTNTFTLNFNSYNAKHQRNMVAAVLAENTINSVTNQVTYDSESGVRTTHSP